MSQHRLRIDDEVSVLFGFDAPTGGFFWSTFLVEGDEFINGDDGLTLTILLDKLTKLFSKNSEPFDEKHFSDELIEDYNNSRHPTELQYNVAKIFGKDLKSLLEDVEKDMLHRYFNRD